jgi:hypothetical protein
MSYTPKTYIESYRTHYSQSSEVPCPQCSNNRNQTYTRVTTTSLEEDGTSTHVQTETTHIEPCENRSAHVGRPRLQRPFHKAQA